MLSWSFWNIGSLLLFGDVANCHGLLATNLYICGIVSLCPIHEPYWLFRTLNLHVSLILCFWWCRKKKRKKRPTLGEVWICLEPAMKAAAAITKDGSILVSFKLGIHTTRCSCLERQLALLLIPLYFILCSVSFLALDLAAWSTLSNKNSIKQYKTQSYYSCEIRL